MQGGSDASELVDQLWPAKVEPEFIAELRSHIGREITPYGDHIDREDYYPLDIVRELGRKGYNTVTIEPEYGGLGLSYKHAVSVIEEVAVASAAVVACMITIFQAHTMIRLFGAESLKTQYLPQFAKGLISSYALTETRHGSDIRLIWTLKPSAMDRTGFFLARNTSCPADRRQNSRSCSLRRKPVCPPSQSHFISLELKSTKAKIPPPSACAMAPTVMFVLIISGCRQTI